jgi:hypothetical protein
VNHFADRFLCVVFLTRLPSRKLTEPQLLTNPQAPNSPASSLYHTFWILSFKVDCIVDFLSPSEQLLSSVVLEKDLKVTNFFPILPLGKKYFLNVPLEARMWPQQPPDGHTRAIRRNLERLRSQRHHRNDDRNPLRSSQKISKPPLFAEQNEPPLDSYWTPLYKRRRKVGGVLFV